MTLTATSGDHRALRSGVRKVRRQPSAGPLRAEVDVGTVKDCVTVTITLIGKGRARRIAAQAATHGDKLKHGVERLVEGLLATPHPAANLGRLASRIEQAGAKKTTEVSEPVRTKASQCTIGVNSCGSVHAELQRLSSEALQNFATVAREAFERGLQSLDERLWSESSKSVLDEFSNTYASFEQDEKKQWSLRISRRAYIKAVLLARENGISQSQLACLCIAAALESHATA